MSRYRNPTTASFTAALDSYAESAGNMYAPSPLPLHKELIPGGLPPDDKPLDVHFELFCLAQVRFLLVDSVAAIRFRSQ